MGMNPQELAQWQEIFNPPRSRVDTVAQFAPTIASFLGGMYSGREAGRSRIDEMLTSQEAMERDWLMNFMNAESTQAYQQAAAEQAQQDRRDRVASAGLLSTQMDPYVQEKALARLQMFNQAAPFANFTINPDLTTSGGGGPAGGFNLSALSAPSLEQARDQFDSYRVGVDPYTDVLRAQGDPNVMAAQQAALTRDADYQNNISNYLGNAAQVPSQETDPWWKQRQREMSRQPTSDGGGGRSWWRTLAGAAAPFAAFIPAVGPLVSIGLGALAGSGQGRGWKGAAQGAGSAALGAYLQNPSGGARGLFPGGGGGGNKVPLGTGSNIGQG